jgi:purine/pyrimidine-nucleoside phosphorylase
MVPVVTAVICEILDLLPTLSYLAPLFSSAEEARMSQFTNVTVVKEANMYFDGKVVSRTVLFPDGSKKTLGVMQPGEYEFGTSQAEVMEIMAGELDVLLPGSGKWQHFSAGSSFDVPANASFKLKVSELTDYCCSYL